MDGIEKITGRIAQDVQKEIDEVNANAQKEAEEIRVRYLRLADKEGDEILTRGRKNAEERVERLGSVAQLEARKLTLAAKQKMLEKAFQKALDDLLNLPENEYIALLANLAVRAARTGKEKVILSQKDRTRFGKQVVTQANDMLAKNASAKPSGDRKGPKAADMTGMLTLSEESRPMKGGLILSDGDVEVNCTFETLVRLQRGEMDREVAKVLFD